MSAKRKRGGSGRKGGKGGAWYAGGPVPVMVLKLLTALVLIFLSRLLFYLFNPGYFSTLGWAETAMLFLAGLRFDLSALLLINTPFILMMAVPFAFREHPFYRRTGNFFFYFINILALFANFVDTIYFRFTLKRITADIFTYVGVGGDFDKLVPQFLRDFWYVAVAWVVFSLLLVWLGSRFRMKPGAAKGSGAGHYLLQSLFFLVVAAGWVIGVRGGFQLRPISLVTAGNYTSARNLPLVLNTPFSIAKSFGKGSLARLQNFDSEKELDKVYTPYHAPAGRKTKPLNVMIIIVESLSREHIGSLNRSLDDGKYQGFTPFLDSLIPHGLYYDAFANGKTSIQGIPAVLSAIPSLMNESFIQSAYAAGRYTGLAGMLGPKGYSSAFFHGGTNGTMGFDSYTRIAGFERYYGRTEYNNEKDYDGKWGIRDEEFFQYTARTINGMKQPFVAALFTLSSHHPYYVPRKYQNIFRKGKLPIQQSVMYADHSLARFFYTARLMPWYGNTLFIITADHTSEGYYPYYQSDVGQYAIPLLFFQPGGGLKGRPDILAQQTDILPTVLDYLGYDRPYIAFGNDLFDTTASLPRFSIRYISGLYGLTRDGWYLESDGTKTTSLFNLRTDPLQKTNLAGREKKRQAELERFLGAYLQQYNNRLIENRMVAD